MSPKVLMLWMMFCIVIVFMTFTFVLLIIDSSSSYGENIPDAHTEKVEKSHDVMQLLKVVKSIVVVLITLFLN